MAGNIIPAIATTNAIIAGVQVLKMLQVLNENWQLCKPGIYLGSQLIAAPFEKPNENCTSCRDSYISVAINEKKCTLQMFIDEIVRNLVSPFEGERELSVFEKERMLFDPDFDDNLSKPLADLGCQSNTFITVVDEDGQYDNVAIVLLPLEYVIYTLLLKIRTYVKINYIIVTKMIDHMFFHQRMTLNNLLREHLCQV